jgi:hypothetical protein
MPRSRSLPMLVASALRQVPLSGPRPQQGQEDAAVADLQQVAFGADIPSPSLPVGRAPPALAGRLRRPPCSSIHARGSQVRYLASCRSASKPPQFDPETPAWRVLAHIAMDEALMARFPGLERATDETLEGPAADPRPCWAGCWISYCSTTAWRCNWPRPRGQARGLFAQARASLPGGRRGDGQ